MSGSQAVIRILPTAGADLRSKKLSPVPAPGASQREGRPRHSLLSDGHDTHSDHAASSSERERVHRDAARLQSASLAHSPEAHACTCLHMLTTPPHIHKVIFLKEN